MDRNGKVTIREVYNLIEKLREDIEQHYVTKSEFLPVRLIVYGMASLGLLTIFRGILSQVEVLAN